MDVGFVAQERASTVQCSLLRDGIALLRLMTIGCSELLARAMYGIAQSPWR